ncbi:hypothetical protein O7C57_11660 [Providencia sp. 21OH12SH02B-Prov]|uniref:hypothetical protein n=1 Tax=Providencia sp. 21OH12SH02B-Prov TaxID=3015951 RepID=UPI0022B7148F|nr:hypothetical protein O7C57_11660 [Providencia sp. 21OH12SH02B-Prov]
MKNNNASFNNGDSCRSISVIAIEKIIVMDNMERENSATRNGNIALKRPNYQSD